MCSRFVRCFESNRAGMMFPLKSSYSKSAFKTDVCLIIPWPMLTSHGTKQTVTYRLYPQTNLHLFSRSRIPQARCRCKPKSSVACGREDKGQGSGALRGTCCKPDSPATVLPLSRSLVAQEPYHMSKFREKEGE